MKFHEVINFRKKKYITMMCNSYFALYQIVFIIESFISKVTKAQLRPRKICLINRHA